MGINDGGGGFIAYMESIIQVWVDQITGDHFHVQQFHGSTHHKIFGKHSEMPLAASSIPACSLESYTADQTDPPRSGRQRPA